VFAGVLRKKPYDNAELKARVDAGRRMLLLQNEMREREKFQGVLEMAGAVCHELNQPLQSVYGYSEFFVPVSNFSECQNYCPTIIWPPAFVKQNNGSTKHTAIPIPTIPFTRLSFLIL
jgi:signal transduction histidine kinase